MICDVRTTIALHSMNAEHLRDDPLHLTGFIKRDPIPADCQENEIYATLPIDLFWFILRPERRPLLF